MAKYIVKGEEAYRPYHEFGYNEKWGKNPDPNPKLQRGKDKNAIRVANVQRERATPKVRRGTDDRLSKRPI